MERERKVGFRQRDKNAARRSAPHYLKRNYRKFEKPSNERKGIRTELDNVFEHATDSQAALTLHNPPRYVRLALTTRDHDYESAKGAIGTAKSVMPERMFERQIRTTLTNNGNELSNVEDIEKILNEGAVNDDLIIHLYHCDPQQSRQKTDCE